MSKTWFVLVLMSLKYCAEERLLKTHVAFFYESNCMLYNTLCVLSQDLGEFDVFHTLDEGFYDYIIISNMAYLTYLSFCQWLYRCVNKSISACSPFLDIKSWIESGGGCCHQHCHCLVRGLQFGDRQKRDVFSLFTHLPAINHPYLIDHHSHLSSCKKKLP
jgi:hypothetical protein